MPEQEALSVSEVPADYGWGPGGKHVVAALRGLTRRERYHVERGYINEATPAMLRSLRAKAMFYLKIESPNGRCGFMRLTPLGESVQATIKARAALRAASEASL